MDCFKVSQFFNDNGFGTFVEENTKSLTIIPTEGKIRTNKILLLHSLLI